MPIKLERPNGATWHEEIARFLAEHLDATHHIDLGWFGATVGSQLCHCFVERNAEGRPSYVSLWMTFPSPVKKQRLCKLLAEAGVKPEAADIYRKAFFDSFGDFEDI